MSLDRRTFVVTSGAVCVGGYVGWRLVSDTPEGERGDGPLQGRSDGGRAVPPDGDVLHVRSGEQRVLDESPAGPYRTIRWEEGGTLTIEPGCGLAVEGDP